MDTLKQTCEYVQQYLKEVHHRELSIEDIMSRPYWRIMWEFFKAKEYYEGKPIEFTMEEVKSIYGK